jgi:hypothetical protein
MNDITFKCLDHLYSLGFKEYAIQYEDEYTYRPSSLNFKDLDNIKIELSRTVSKVDWGMIWAK